MLQRTLYGVALVGLSTFAPALSLRERVDAELAKHVDATIAFRRDLHRHPELSGAEARTAIKVADALRSFGLDVRTDVGGHGVIGILRGGKPGPLIAYRADMDAFPSIDPDPVALAAGFASENAGVRHICGHDLHTAIGLAIAQALSAVRVDLPGRVMFIFQPAEERATGAKAMLAAGVFASERPVAIYGVHTAPLPVGTLGTSGGVLMAGRDVVRVVVSGSGNLAAVADSARRLIENTGTVRMPEALAPAPAGFVFADVAPIQRMRDSSWAVRGTLSIADQTVREQTRTRLLASLSRLSHSGKQVKASYEALSIAGVSNDASLTARANTSIRSAMGAGTVVDVADVIPAFSEDFGSFQQRVPGVFYFLGVANAEKGWSGMPHSPDYVADESALLVGARAMAAVLLDRLGAR